MRALERKLLRDLWRLKGQSLAISLLVACALTTFVMSKATWESLLVSQRTYYDRSRFADLFASLRRAPRAVAARIAALPEVAALAARVVADVPLQVPGVDEPVTGRVVGTYGEPAVNKLHLRRGRLVERGQAGEVVVGEAFAKAHHLELGSQLAAVVRGRQQPLHVVGIAISPEYVMTVRPSDLMPDDRHYGVLWLEAEGLAAALDLAGAFNDVTLRVRPGASIAGLKAELDRMLAPYGSFGATDRSQNVSHRFLSDEIRQLKGTAVVVPTIFLIVAAFLLQVVLGRLVATQREQIAVLKAFGYSSLQTALHYAVLAAVVILVGAAVGVVAGNYAGAAMTKLYARYYRLPVYLYALDPGDLLAAGLVSMVAAAVGTAGALGRVLRLPAAVALRPEPPHSFRPSFIERLGLGGVLGSSGRMVLRNVTRRPLRTLLSALGISFSVALLVVGGFFEDAMTYLMDHSFRQAMRETAAVSFERPQPLAAVRELSRLPGVVEIEPQRTAPARIRNGQFSYLGAVLGLPDGSRLRRLLDQRGRAVSLPLEGAVLSRKLAEILRTAPGQTIRLEFLDGKRAVHEIRVAALVDDLLGVTLSMRLAVLNRLLGEGPRASAAVLLAEPGQVPALGRRLRALPGVEGVSLRESAIKTFERMLADSVLVFASILVGFAIVIALGVVYNGARVTLAERERELSTLRLIGLTRGEVATVLLGEIGLHLLLGIPLGLLLGAGLAAISAAYMNSDLYRIPVVLEGSTYLFAAGVALASALVVGWRARLRLDRLDWVTVLKTKE